MCEVPRNVYVFLFVQTSDEHTSCVSSEMAVGEMCNNSFSRVFIVLAFGRVTMTHVPRTAGVTLTQRHDLW